MDKHLQEIISQLDSYDIDPIEKVELIDLIHQTYHHHVLNVVLNYLPHEHHESFLSGAKSLDSLKKEIKIDIDKAILAQAERIKKEILIEIKRSSSSTF